MVANSSVIYIVTTHTPFTRLKNYCFTRYITNNFKMITKKNSDISNKQNKRDYNYYRKDKRRRYKEEKNIDRFLKTNNIIKLKKKS